MDKQPEPIDIEIPIAINKETGDRAIMYSMVDEFNLRRLRNFLDELIRWKASGNTCYETLYYAIITEIEETK